MAALRAPLRPHLFRQAPRLLSSTPRPSSRRFESTSSFDHLQNELPARKLPIVWDYLVPTPSHLLDIALNDLVQPDTNTQDADTFARNLPLTAKAGLLPHAHHLIYFPPPIPGASLLPDGTDPLQSPGEPFVRRMWAGGAARFNLSRPDLLQLDGGRAACMESIRDVAIKGRPGEEKVFVGIERRVGRVDERDSEHIVKQKFWRDDEADFGDAVGVIERRNIVFMRERSREQAQADVTKAKQRQMQPPTDKPDVELVVRPDTRLLFRYSALTYNAHAIHLDPQYCREVEGHRGLLVHGPLSFTLLVTMLQRRLAADGRAVAAVEYRNLAPLYAGEALRLCARQTESNRWEAWAETPEGGVAVNAKVWTAAT